MLNIEDTTFFEACNDILNEKVNELITEKIDALQQRLIASLESNGISEKDIIAIVNRYRNKITVNLRPYLVKKQRAKRVVNSVKRCMARIGLGTQCSRSKINGDFCKSHNNTLPYGRVLL